MNPPRLGSACPISCGSVVYTSLSLWWFISTLQLGQIILSVLVTAAILVFGDQSIDIRARPWRSVFAIQMSSWLFYRSGFIRMLPDIRGHEHLFRLGEKRLEELNRLLSAYRWSPQVQILRGFLFQMRPRQTEKTTLSQRREYWIVESLLRDAERGNLYRYKTCPECKKWFYTLTDHQRFCGDSCRKRYSVG